MPDVIVVGAGLAGLCCARELRAAGLDVLVLERARRARRARAHGRGRRLPAGPRLPGAAHGVPRGAPRARLRAPRAAALRERRAHPPGRRLRAPRRPRPPPASRRSRACAGRPAASRTSCASPACAGASRATRSTSCSRRRRSPPRRRCGARASRAASSTAFFRPFLGGIFLDPSLETSSRLFAFVFKLFAEGEAALPAAGMQAIPRQLAEGLPEAAVRYGATVESAAAGRGRARRRRAPHGAGRRGRRGRAGGGPAHRRRRGAGAPGP